MRSLLRPSLRPRPCRSGSSGRAGTFDDPTAPPTAGPPSAARKSRGRSDDPRRGSPRPTPRRKPPEPGTSFHRRTGGARHQVPNMPLLANPGRPLIPSYSSLLMSPPGQCVPQVSSKRGTRDRKVAPGLQVEGKVTRLGRVEDRSRPRDPRKVGGVLSPLSSIIGPYCRFDNTCGPTQGHPSFCGGRLRADGRGTESSVGGGRDVFLHEGDPARMGTILLIDIVPCARPPYCIEAPYPGRMNSEKFRRI